MNTLILVAQVCSDLNIQVAGKGMIDCLVPNLFGTPDWTVIALVFLGLIAFGGYVLRLPSVLSIGFGFS